MPSRAVGPGPASLAGLDWLARVGPASEQAWGTALGWTPSTTRFHALRLMRAHWLTRVPTSYGQGSLHLATRRGVERLALDVTIARPPAPTWWEHCRAVAWTAAWLSRRGQLGLGALELAGDELWRGELRWRERSAGRVSGHTPDLVRVIDGVPVAVEVELARKSTARLSAILDLHARWRAQGRTAGVLYVCGSERGCERIRAAAERHGLTRGAGGLGLRTVEQVRSEARELAAARRAA